MTKSKKKRMMKYMQKQLNRTFAYIMLMNILIVFMIVSTVFVRTSGNNQIEGRNYLTVYESNDHNTVSLPANVLTDNLIVFETNNNEINTNGNKNNGYNFKPYNIAFTRGLSEDDKYLLAKIAMAEAEGESFETKVLVISVVLNRVNSEGFPNTIRDVIFQELNGVYQFTPIADGRWDRVEPNEECWRAVDTVNTNSLDLSNGALYFEACSGKSWHSENLEFICQMDNTRFYK